MRTVISGAGISGLSLAYWLGGSGHDVLVLERGPALRGAGYMIDFFGPGWPAAEAMGLLERLEAIHCPIERLAFVDRDGHERFSLPYGLARRRLFGGHQFNFLRGDLERVLLEALGPRASVRYGARVVALRQERREVVAVLADGRSERCDLFVGADGIHSETRQWVGGGRERFIGCFTAACVLNQSPEALGLERGVFATYSEAGRQVAVYPIGDRRLAIFFLHRTESPVAAVDAAAARVELQRAYAGMPWLVPQLLAGCMEAEDLYYDDVSQVEAWVWSRGRVALLGDAACCSLIAGQGASLAIAGAKLLASMLARHPETEAALWAYEQRLRPAMRSRQATRRMMSWFVPASPTRLRLRDLMMRLSLFPPAAAMLRKRMAGAELLA